MNRCIYCCEDKADSEFTLEHVIPQFLGGAYAPDCYKVRNVCGRCNSNLGLFVDAGFEKNWFVSNTLREIAYSTFNPSNQVGLPLICMGQSDLSPPQMQEDEICESWLGPLGEQIYWVRPHDERLFWYVGGNPRTTKKIESRAYFLFSERSAKNPMLSWLTFRDSFDGRRVKKIMCTIVDGANPKEIGFHDADDLDVVRVRYFNDACNTSHTRKNGLAIYIRYDFRFLAKLALGMAYALFGNKALQTAYADQLYDALWYKDGDDPPKINGASALMQASDPQFAQLVGHENAVTISVMPIPQGIAVNLNLGASLNWLVMCATYENLNTNDIEAIGHGRVIVLNRNQLRGVALSLPDYLAHKCGAVVHPQLAEMSANANAHREYFKNL